MEGVKLALANQHIAGCDLCGADPTQQRAAVAYVMYFDQARLRPARDALQGVQNEWHALTAA